MFPSSLFKYGTNKSLVSKGLKTGRLLDVSGDFTYIATDTTVSNSRSENYSLCTIAKRGKLEGFVCYENNIVRSASHILVIRDHVEF